MKTTENKALVYDYLYSILIILLPLSFALPNIILGLLVLLFIVDIKNFKTKFLQDFFRPSLLLLPILIFFWFGKDIITKNFSENKHSLFIITPILLILFLKIQNKNRILISIVISGIIAIARASFGLFQNYTTNHELLPFEGTVVNEILKMERPYLGFLSLIAAIVSFYLGTTLHRFKWLFYINTFVNCLFIFIISARISSISLLLIVLIYLLIYLETKIQRKLIFVFTSLILCSAIITWNKNIRDRLFISGSFSEGFSKFKTYEPRFVIWPCAYEISQSSDFNMFVGINSEKKIENMLAEGYQKRINNKFKADYYAQEKLNTHNQFLATYLNSGIIGLFGLIIFFIGQFYIHRKNFFKTALFLAIFLFLLVENVFFRQLGIYFFGIILALNNASRNTFSTDD